jgi:transcriptional regulator with XRE-family HTH domain
MPVDQRWFQTAIKNANLSQRRLAQMLDMDPASLSLTLRGKRKMQIGEATALAEHLNLPVDEVLAHAGTQIPKGPTAVPIVGYIGQGGEIHARKTRSQAPAHNKLPKDTVAIRCEDQGSALYGWLFYYVPADGIACDAIGRACVVTLPRGDRHIFVPQRGFEPSVYNLWGVTTEPAHSQHIIGATPILWIKP